MIALSQSLIRGCWQGLLLALVVAITCALLPRLRSTTRQALWWCVCLKFVVAAIWFAPPELTLPASRIHLPWIPVDSANAQPEALAYFANSQESTLINKGPSILVFVWVLGAAVVASRILYDSFKLTRLSKSANAVEPATLTEARRIAAQMGLKQMPLVKESSQITSPLVYGSARPILILPTTFSEFTAEERSMALAHELAHVNRGDLLFGVVPALATVLFWFFPIAYWARNAWIGERESACDAEALLATHAAPKRYGELLLKITAADHVALPKSTIGATADFGSIKKRLERLATAGGKGFSFSPGLVVCGLLLPVVPWQFKLASPQHTLPTNEIATLKSLPSDKRGSGGLEGVRTPVLRTKPNLARRNRQAAKESQSIGDPKMKLTKALLPIAAMSATTAAHALTPQTDTAQLHSVWAERFKGIAPDDWRAGFSAGMELARLPNSEGYEILKENWKPEVSEKARMQTFKGWVFTDKPDVFKVLDLGMRDPSVQVQNWTMEYLRDLAFVDFSEDIGTYPAWYRAHSNMPVREVEVEGILNALRLAKHSGGDQQDRIFRLLRGAARIQTSKSSPEVLAASKFLFDSDALSDDGENALTAVIRFSKPTAEFMRPYIIAWLKSNSIEKQGRAIEAIYAAPGPYAFEPLKDYLMRMLRVTNRTPPMFGIGRDFAALKDPRAVPLLIGALAFDGTYSTVYGLGYFGLTPLTGVEYDKSHDGTWWKSWWKKNSGRFPKPVANTAIPTFPANP